MSLFIALIFCLALSGCGGAGKQHESQTEYSPGNSESSTETSTGRNFGSSTGRNSGSSTERNSGSNADNSTDSTSDNSGGGSELPPAQESKIIKSVEAVSDIAVAYGTNEVDAMAKLPDTVTLKCEDGSMVQARVLSWTLDKSYNAQPQNRTTCVGTGTVAIPEGYSYAGTLAVTANITVCGGDETIQGLAAPVSGVEVYYNTSEADAMKKLPGNVSLLTYDGKTVSANVAWARKSETYNATPTSAATVTYVGTVSIPNGYTYIGTLEVTAGITVRGGDRTIKKLTGPKNGFEVNYGTSEADAKKRLPSEVRLISYTDDSSFATVTWTQKGDETYNATPASDTTVTYIGTVQIPDGYYFNGDTTIETTITVLESGRSATPKDVKEEIAPINIYIESYTTDMDEIKGHLPGVVRLYCEDDSPITVTVDKTKWNMGSRQTESGNYYKYVATYSFGDITLPDGYVFSTSSMGSASISIYVKKRDNTRLQEALKAAREQQERVSPIEVLVLEYPDTKIFKVADGTKPSEVATGVKFIQESEVEDKLDNLDYLIDGMLTADRYNPDESQAAVDALADEMNEATAVLKAILDNNCQIGTGFTTANIIFNVRKALDSFEGNSNYAYDPANQPMKPQLSDESCLTFPTEVRVVINANGDLADVKLNWTIGDTSYAEIRKDAYGTQYVWVKKPAEPRDISFTVRAIGYYEGNKWVDLNDEQIEAYNNCCVGAPISKDESQVTIDDIPKLTSGKDSSFAVSVPFKYSYYEKMIEIDIDPSRITVTDDSSYTGGTLLNNLKVTGVHTDQKVPVFDMTATAAQLPAVINPNETNQYVKGKVKISVPADAITLTEYAVETNWYVPDGSWEFEADVWVYNPAVTVKSAQLSSNNSRVTVDFSTAHWSGSQDVQMALVPSSADSFDGTATDSFVLSDAVTVNADIDYTTSISASGIAAGDYTVWVKVGNGKWQKSTAGLKISS